MVNFGEYFGTVGANFGALVSFCASVPPLAGKVQCAAEIALWFLAGVSVGYACSGL